MITLSSFNEATRFSSFENAKAACATIHAESENKARVIISATGVLFVAIYSPLRDRLIGYARDTDACSPFDAYTKITKWDGKK